MNQEKSCGAIVFTRQEGQLLYVLVQEASGAYSFPKGHMECGETEMQTALREIREETGLEVRLDHFLGIFHNHNMVWSNGDAAHVISAMFTATIVSGEPRIDEESYELRFFGKEEIPELFAEDHIAALEAYFRGVRRPMLQENVYKAND
jgi:ADP-ribose pyrophosphatase YjhB (NUDIX family)